MSHLKHLFSNTLKLMMGNMRGNIHTVVIILSVIINFSYHNHMPNCLPLRMSACTFVNVTIVSHYKQNLYFTAFDTAHLFLNLGRWVEK